MATYKKQIKDADGNTIIPAFGGSILTPDLANGAVTSDKIDFTTMGFKYLSIGAGWVPSSAETIGTVTIEKTGFYLVGFSASIDKQNDNSHRCDFDVAIQGQEGSPIAFARVVSGSSWDFTACGFGFAQLTAGQVLLFRDVTDDGSWWYRNQARMFALRVG